MVSVSSAPASVISTTGPVVTSLTQHGGTSPSLYLDSHLFSTGANIRYTRTLTTAPGVAAEIRNGLAVIVVHGIDYNGNGVYDNSLGAGAEAGAPYVSRDRALEALQVVYGAGDGLSGEATARRVSRAAPHRDGRRERTRGQRQDGDGGERNQGAAKLEATHV